MQVYVVVFAFTIQNVFFSMPEAVKKFKHKIVEKMKDSTADTLGITRAVLVNGN